MTIGAIVQRLDQSARQINIQVYITLYRNMFHSLGDFQPKSEKPSLVKTHRLNFPDNIFEAPSTSRSRWRGDGNLATFRLN